MAFSFYLHLPSYLFFFFSLKSFYKYSAQIGYLGDVLSNFLSTFLSHY